MSARSFAPHVLVLLALAALAAIAAALAAREKPAPGVLAVGSEVVVMHPTGEKTKDGRDVMTTAHLRVVPRGAGVGAGLWTLQVNGVIYPLGPAE